MTVKVGDLIEAAIAEKPVAPVVIPAGITLGPGATLEVVNGETIIHDPNDPYDSPGERAEGMFVGRYLATFTKDPDGFVSTYREWHIFNRGIYSGFNTVLGAKFDPMPYYWTDEAQYYEGGQELGYILKNGAAYIPTTAITTLIVTNLPYISEHIPTVLNMLKSLIGM